MERLLRLSGAGMGGMGSGQGATDAPVVDTAEQVTHYHSSVQICSYNAAVFRFIFHPWRF